MMVVVGGRKTPYSTTNISKFSYKTKKIDVYF
jgi:hypothetical protein